MRFDTLGGRRFLLAFGAGCATTTLQWFGKLDADGSSYAMVIIGIVVAYITGNVAESRKFGSAE